MWKIEGRIACMENLLFNGKGNPVRAAPKTLVNCDLRAGSILVSSKRYGVPSCGSLAKMVSGWKWSEHQMTCLRPPKENILFLESFLAV
jgi:hypothetical protein